MPHQSEKSEAEKTTQKYSLEQMRIISINWYTLCMVVYYQVKPIHTHFSMLIFVCKIHIIFAIKLCRIEFTNNSWRPEEGKIRDRGQEKKVSKRRENMAIRKRLDNKNYEKELENLLQQSQSTPRKKCRHRQVYQSKSVERQTQSHTNKQSQFEI